MNDSTNAVAAAPEVRRKLTVSEIIGGKVDFKAFMAFEHATPGAVYWLCRILGIANSAKPGESANGPYVRFFGQFKGYDEKTGKAIYSGSMILPGVAQDLLYGVLSDPSNTGIQFGIKLGIRYKEDAATKYVYVCESTLKPSGADPLALLEEAINKGMPAPMLGFTAPTPQPDTTTAEPAAQPPAETPATAETGKKRK